MLTIIIVNYKNEQKTIDYVEQELSKIKINHRIVIVNNGATEQSDHILTDSLHACLVHDINKNYPLCLCYIISNPKNSGFAQGNNLGATFARNHFQPDFILFSNNDIRLLSNDVVEKLIDKIQANPTVGMIGPKVIGLDGGLQSPEPYFPFWDNYILIYLFSPFVSKQYKRKRFKMDYAEHAKEGFHYKIMGSFFIVSAQDFYSCGMMDSNTFLFNEEVILSERMQRIGKLVYYDPEVSILHEHGKTIQKYNSKMRIRNLMFESASYYYRTYKKVSLISIFIGNIIKHLLNILRK